MHSLTLNSSTDLSAFPRPDHKSGLAGKRLIARVYAAIEAGVRIFDSSCGGLGGCPFAPGATGNVGTEDVLYLVERMGFHTGISMSKLIETSNWLGQVIGQEMPSMVHKAGSFP